MNFRDRFLECLAAKGGLACNKMVDDGPEAIEIAQEIDVRLVAVDLFGGQVGPLRSQLLFKHALLQAAAFSALTSRRSLRRATWSVPRSRMFFGVMLPWTRRCDLLNSSTG